MSNKVSLHGAITRTLAPRPLKPVPKTSVPVASLKHNHQAEKVIRNAFGAMGLGDAETAWVLRQRALAGGQLMSKPFGAVSAETRRFAKLLLDLRGNPHATNKQKIRFAGRYASMQPGRGRRQVLASLAQKPAFWKTLGSGHRDIVYYHLKRAQSTAASKKLGRAFSKVMDNKLFGRASSQGRKNALSQPHRAAKILVSYDKSKVRLPRDTTRANRDIQTYTRRFSGLKRRDTQQGLAREMVDVRKRVLARFFENVSTYKKLAGRSVWYGENYRRYATFTWEQTLEEYVNARRRQERCGAIGGGRARCLD